MEKFFCQKQNDTFLSSDERSSINSIRNSKILSIKKLTILVYQTHPEIKPKVMQLKYYASYSFED